MSHPTNSALWDILMDAVPAVRVKELLSQGLSEIDILNKFRTKELNKIIEGCAEHNEPDCLECTGDVDKLDAMAILQNDEHLDDPDAFYSNDLRAEAERDLKEQLI